MVDNTAERSMKTAASTRRRVPFVPRRARTPKKIVIIGSGINGLVAAAELADHGCEVVLLERAERIGGFIAAQERTLPGFIHDVYSSWHTLFVCSPAYGVLAEKLRACGLEYVNAQSAVTASVADIRGQRQTAVAYRDPFETAARLDSERDRCAYLEMLDEFGRRSSVTVDAMGRELRSGRTLAALGWKAFQALGIRGAEGLARDALSSGRGFLRRNFDGWEIDAMWSPWLLHAGLGPDHATGGLMIPMLAATLHQFGVPTVLGGAGRFIEAFESLFDDYGVDFRTGTQAERILLRGNRVRGVATSSGPVAADAVLASVGPQALYGTLLDGVPKLDAHRKAAQRYRPGRGAAQVHLALEHPVPWEDSELRQVPLIHLSDGSNSTAIAVAQAEAGLLPARPTVVVGQQSQLDPSRAPEGRATLWVQLQEVPYAPTGDSAEVIAVDGGWINPALRDSYLDRVLDQIEQFAPGFHSSVLASDFIAPTDLVSANPCALNGDPYAGSGELDQNMLWRPFPAGANHRTPIGGLWHIGASTHPGPGLGGGSGHLAAQQVLRRLAASQ
ncbi:NAD(P)/FAD-dependent oxidoreductase [Mycolicibacterium sp. XJ2546]